MSGVQIKIVMSSWRTFVIIELLFCHRYFFFFALKSALSDIHIVFYAFFDQCQNVTFFSIYLHLIHICICILNYNIQWVLFLIHLAISVLIGAFRSLIFKELIEIVGLITVSYLLAFFSIPIFVFYYFLHFLSILYDSIFPSFSDLVFLGLPCSFQYIFIANPSLLCNISVSLNMRCIYLIITKQFYFFSPFLVSLMSFISLIYKDAYI